MPALIITDLPEPSPENLQKSLSENPKKTARFGVFFLIFI